MGVMKAEFLGLMLCVASTLCVYAVSSGGASIGAETAEIKQSPQVQHGQRNASGVVVHNGLFEQASSEMGRNGDDVFARGLVQEQLTAQQILQEHHRYSVHTDEKRFNGTTLGFVTPWNSHGYDVAKIFNGKFDIVSPVWFELGLASDGEVTLSGTHDVDMAWMEAVRGEKGAVNTADSHQCEESADGSHICEKAKAARPLILPRVAFRLSRLDQAILLRTLELLANACDTYGFDGYVLEFLIHPQIANTINLIGTKLKALLKEKGRDITLVGVAHANRPDEPSRSDVIPYETFAALTRSLDQFVIMTYDFSKGFTFGPNAPIRFVEQAIKTVITRPDGTIDQDLAAKILVGIPLYGYQRGQPVIGSQVAEWLAAEDDASVHWHDFSKEHFFGQGFSFTYPTPMFIEARLQLIRSYGCGVSLWEIGQGMDFFFDLF